MDRVDFHSGAWAVSWNQVRLFVEPCLWCGAEGEWSLAGIQVCLAHQVELEVFQQDRERLWPARFSVSDNWWFEVLELEMATRTSEPMALAWPSASEEQTLRAT